MATPLKGEITANKLSLNSNEGNLPSEGSAESARRGVSSPLRGEYPSRRGGGMLSPLRGEWPKAEGCYNTPMQFQVPQFVEVEDKIFWGLTWKQFIYLAGGVGLSVLAFMLLPSVFLSIPIIIFVMALSLALTFYRVNNRPFIVVLESMVKYYLGSKLYIWQKEEKIAEKSKNASAVDSFDPTVLPKIADSKLKDLTWSLGTKENANPVTNGDTATK